MAKGDLRPHWHKDNPVVHKVKPPQAKPKDEFGYIKFLVEKHKAIIKYLMDKL